MGKWFKKAQHQRKNLIVVQRSLRKYMSVRTWLWFGFWQALKPKLNVGREAKMLEEQKAELAAALEECKGGAAQYVEKEAKLMSQKADSESQLEDAKKRLEAEVQAKNALQQAVKKTEAEVGNVKQEFEDLEAKLQAAVADK